MNARALKIGVACPNPSRRLIISLTTLLLLTWCINNAHATAVTRTDTNNWSPNQLPACGDKVIVRNSGTCTVTDNLHDSASIPASILETTHQPPIHPAIEEVQT